LPGLLCVFLAAGFFLPDHVPLSFCHMFCGVRVFFRTTSGLPPFRGGRAAAGFSGRSNAVRPFILFINQLYPHSPFLCGASLRVASLPFRHFGGPPVVPMGTATPSSSVGLLFSSVPSVSLVLAHPPKTRWFTPPPFPDSAVGARSALRQQPPPTPPPLPRIFSFFSSQFDPCILSGHCQGLRG